MGVSISREKNKQRGLEPFESSSSGKNNLLVNFTLYMPTDPEKKHEALSNYFSKISDESSDIFFEGMTLELDLRIKSNLKLSLLNKNGKVNQVNDPKSEEIHFIKFEGVMPRRTKEEKQFLRQLWDFENWTITDFDNYLEGNPHC